MSARTGMLNIDWQDFLARYWQRKPLLFRQPLQDFHAPLSANELAGLALEEHIESRIVERNGANWNLLHGPFTAEDFVRPTPWTLLVQAVDHFVPEVNALRPLFAPIPGWRMDDIMVSYAVDGGSVGPHFDNYDVFLLQGEGRRLWRIGQNCDNRSPLLAHDDLRILQHFDCTEEFMLEPGDMLYLPPGVAHWGIAQGECTTFSIGFRAPRINDMLSRNIDALLEQRTDDSFYSDAGASSAKRAGEIRPEDRARVQEQLREALEQYRSDEWFGELVTEPRYDDLINIDEIEASHTLLNAAPMSITLTPGARLAWQSNSSDNLQVFANGVSCEAHASALPTIVILCANEQLQGKELQQALQCTQTRTLLEWLVDCGCIDVE